MNATHAYSHTRTHTYACIYTYTHLLCVYVQHKHTHTHQTGLQAPKWCYQSRNSEKRYCQPVFGPTLHFSDLSVAIQHYNMALKMPRRPQVDWRLKSGLCTECSSRRQENTQKGELCQKV